MDLLGQRVWAFSILVWLSNCLSGVVPIFSPTRGVGECMSAHSLETLSNSFDLCCLQVLGTQLDKWFLLLLLVKNFRGREEGTCPQPPLSRLLHTKQKTGVSMLRLTPSALPGNGELTVWHWSYVSSSLKALYHLFLFTKFLRNIKDQEGDKVQCSGKRQDSLLLITVTESAFWSTDLILLLSLRLSVALYFSKILDQRHQQHRGTGWTCTFLGPSADLLSQTLEVGLSKPSGDADTPWNLRTADLQNEVTPFHHVVTALLSCSSSFPLSQLQNIPSYWLLLIPPSTLSPLYLGQKPRVVLQLLTEQ